MTDQPEQPTDQPDQVWCDVCQEHIPAGYAQAHAEQPSPDALERLRHQLRMLHRDPDETI